MATTPAAGGPSGAASTSSSSNDPLLTTLCAICHIQPPKYKCPACDTRTQKENGTNAKEADTKVEVEADDNADNSSSDEEHDDRAGRNKIPTTRFLGKAMDNAPLYSAFGHGHRAHLNALRKKEEQQQRSPFDVAADPSTKPKSRPKQPPPQAATQSQDPSTGTWLPGHYVLQPHPHPAWKPYAGATHFKSAAAPEPEDMPKDKYRFFISPVRSPFAAAAAAATAPSSEAKVPVHALDPTTSLAEALRDTTVLEFPTIYALPADAALPSAFALTPKRDPADATAQKRKRDAASQSRRPQDQKGKKKPRRRLEDGEGASDDDDNDDAGSVQGGTSNLMEIVAEESLGDDDDEDEDDDDDDDDATSSSGSDDSDGEDDATINASIARKLASLGRI
ncbi:Folylpolyglutamate synthase [Verticillium dahliae VDG2]|nr:Folylpolyglutamate synthase [Verticillium dahliae VDG2]